MDQVHLEAQLLRERIRRLWLELPAATTRPNVLDIRCDEMRKEAEWLLPGQVEALRELRSLPAAEGDVERVARKARRLFGITLRE